MRPAIHTVFRMARSRFFQESLCFTNARSAAFRTDSVAYVYSVIVVARYFTAVSSSANFCSQSTLSTSSTTVESKASAVSPPGNRTFASAP